MSEIMWKSALELLDMIRSKEISPVEVVTASLERLREVEPKINAFLDVTEDQAMDAAKVAEAAVAAGDELGPLHGLPVSIKDLIAVKGARLTFGSRAMADNVSDVDAPSVARIRAAGGAIIGKSTTSEFGCKAVGDSPLTGITRNPWNLEKTPGGSSCGAAASIASGVTPFGLGTDGGGSVRIPSALTGLFGIKAHFGRVPVFPASATPTLAHVGPLARTVRDGALLLQTISGFDARDSGAVSQDVPDFLAACDRSPEGLRVAWSPTLGYGEPDPQVLSAVSDAVKVFEDLGCQVTEVAKVFDDPLDLMMSEFFAGAGTRLRPVLESSRELLDPSVAYTLESALGQEMGDYYTKVFERYDLRNTVCDFFEDYDLLLTPTLPVTAFDVGNDYPPGRGSPDNSIGWLTYTYPFNLTGLPAASVPCGFVDGLPVGLQIVGRHLGEVDIFRAAAAFEEARPWADRKPALN
ncbi:MAG: amidase family protein [Alphaproteobacteria bacterium]|nr:amidase family protein [Alphaproteobacteria bacterium]